MNLPKKRATHGAPAFLAAAAIVLFNSNAGLQAAPNWLQSERTQTQLLELYTSEGCSSCPPADKFVSKLKNDKRLWRDVVPVVFHVDYWDRLGWKDRFASSTYTARQHANVRAQGGSRVYTPEFFINGREWKGFFTRRNVPRSEARQVGILKAAQGADDNWRVTFKPTDKRISGWTVSAARLGTGLESAITSGENRGRTLLHDFTVLSFAQSEMKKEAGEFVATIPLSPDQIEPNAKRAIAVWVSPAGQLTPTKSLGGWIDAPSAARTHRE